MGNPSEGKVVDYDTRCGSCDEILIGDEKNKLICEDCEGKLTDKDYHNDLLSLGYKLDWVSGSTRAQYSNSNVYIDVCEQEDGYHEFAMCPKENFDRWANSRHINWKLMVANYTEEKKCGWTQEKVKEDFKQNVKDSEWFCDTVPSRMFDKFINIDL